MHVRRDARSAQEIVTLRASPSSVQGSAQEILVVCNLETLGNYPLSCCERVCLNYTGSKWKALVSPVLLQLLHGCRSWICRDSPGREERGGGKKDKEWRGKGKGRQKRMKKEGKGKEKGEGSSSQNPVEFTAAYRLWRVINLCCDMKLYIWFVFCLFVFFFMQKLSQVNMVEATNAGVGSLGRFCISQYTRHHCLWPHDSDCHLMHARIIPHELCALMHE